MRRSWATGGAPAHGPSNGAGVSLLRQLLSPRTEETIEKAVIEDAVVFFEQNSTAADTGFHLAISDTGPWDIFTVSAPDGQEILSVHAIGPLAAVISTAQTGLVSAESSIPIWVLVLGGAGIVVGLATYGRHVIATVGTKITQLTPSRGFAAGVAAATTIVIASGTGMPISTTHTLVGAVLGVGLARGIDAIDLRVVSRIMVSWVVTIPAGAFLAIIFFFIFRAVLP